MELHVKTNNVLMNTKLSALYKYILIYVYCTMYIRVHSLHLILYNIQNNSLKVDFLKIIKPDKLFVLYTVNIIKICIQRYTHSTLKT